MPFILKAGKALNERKVEIRIQFRPPAAELNQSLDPLRNELVIRLQPDEAVYLKMVRPLLVDCPASAGSNHLHGQLHLTDT